MGRGEEIVVRNDEWRIRLCSLIGQTGLPSGEEGGRVSKHLSSFLLFRKPCLFDAPIHFNHNSCLLPRTPGQTTPDINGSS